MDLIETPDSAELVSCLLELDEYEKINFKFGLNTDLPQDIANRLVSRLDYNFIINVLFKLKNLRKKHVDIRVQANSLVREYKLSHRTPPEHCASHQHGQANPTSKHKKSTI